MTTRAAAAIVSLTVMMADPIGFSQSAPTSQSAAQDHQRMMALLKIQSLRRGADANPTSPFAANSDESKADKYGVLPDPLVLDNGQRVMTPQQWWEQRRPEIVELFDREIYGRVPNDLPAVKWEVVSRKNDTVASVPVVTKQLVGHVDNSTCPAIEVPIQLTLTTPAEARGPVPVRMEFGFGPMRGAATRRAAAATSRPIEAGPSWQQQVLSRGWGYAILIPSSIQADNGAGLTRGIIGLANRGQPRKPDDWGALRAWAWGASRAMDYFESDNAVDAKHVGIEGLSRYGKAALVTMAYDPRFAIAFVASSGAGGAKLLRRDFGEQVENLASAAEYHWFAGNFLKYAGPLTPGDLPVDAHELIALCAPRPVFISAGSPAVEGTWIDARGTFLAAVAAGPVYQLLGKRGLESADMPPIGTGMIDSDIAWRQHIGGHSAGPNWPAFLRFASRYFGNSPAVTPTSSVEYSNRADQPAARSEDSVWAQKHEDLVELARRGTGAGFPIDLYFAGDSITRRWQATHRANWDHNFGGWRAADFGAGGDRTQNVLYRIENGELDGVNPKVIVLMIGTNNVGASPPQGSEDRLAEEVAGGIEACVTAMRQRAPQARILLMGITPRNTHGRPDPMPTINRINRRIASFGNGTWIRFLNINDRLADSDGKLFDGVAEDGLHLSNKGYQIWADAMKPTLLEWLSTPAATDPAKTDAH